jgi:hypothetical protein
MPENTKVVLSRSPGHNVQVTSGTNPATGARSESTVAVSPANPNLILAASKTFMDRAHYDYNVAAYISDNGGVSWREFDPPIEASWGGLDDPCVAFDNTGRGYVCGMFNGPVGSEGETEALEGIACYTSTGNLTTWAPPTFPDSTAGNLDDKDWFAVDQSGGLYDGRIYGFWDITATNPYSLGFSRSLDGGQTWMGFGSPANPAATPLVAGGVTIGSSTPYTCIGPDSSLHVFWVQAQDIWWTVSYDGGDSFAAPQAVTAGIGFFAVEPSNVTLPFRTYTFPTSCVVDDTLILAWADDGDPSGMVRIYFRAYDLYSRQWLGDARGAPLLTGTVATGAAHHELFPQLSSTQDALVLAFYQYGPNGPQNQDWIDVVVAVGDDGIWNRITVTDQPWDPTVAEVTDERGSGFIGDYFGLDAQAGAATVVWTDTRTGLQEIFTSQVQILVQSLRVVTDQNEFAYDTVNALHPTAASPAEFPASLYVIAGGFTPEQVGVNSTMTQAQMAAQAPPLTFTDAAGPVGTMTYKATLCEPEDSTLPAGIPQSFTFTYTIEFTGTGAFPVGGAQDTVAVTVTATGFGLADEGTLTLTYQPSPYMLDGATSWLSEDLRVFQVTQGVQDPIFGLTCTGDQLGYLGQVLAKLRGPGGHALFESMPTAPTPFDPTGSELELSQKVGGVPVFNFAIAQVRYAGGTLPADQVPVAFRLFTTAVTGTDYDPTGTYATNGATPPVALLGLHFGELASIPCYASTRQDPLTGQTDPGNILNFPATGGVETYDFAGCWLDFNQPMPTYYPRDTTSDAGPWPAADKLPIQSLIRGLHQCLVAQIIYGVEPAAGTSTANTDKLAQRNLAIVGGDNPGGDGARTLSHTFQLKALGGIRIRDAALAGVAFGSTDAGDDVLIPPDLLAVHWDNLPAGTSVEVYLPTLDADEILALAADRPTPPRLQRVDPHTLHCAGPAVTYIPLPSTGSTAQIPGLLTVTTPAGTRAGELYQLHVQQITGSPARVVGGFQLSIPIRKRADLLGAEARHLSVLRYIALSIPPQDPWHQVFIRHLTQIALRLREWGFDPDTITPSPDGSGVPPPGHRHRRRHRHHRWHHHRDWW